MLSGQGSERWIWRREAFLFSLPPKSSVSGAAPATLEDTEQLWANEVRDGLKTDGTKNEV